MKALTYAYCSKSAYSAKPTFGDESSSARAIADLTADGPVISFPGTNNVACWLADLDAEIIEVENLGALHKGFWTAFDSIRADLMTQTPIVVTGHSEGAALALIYAAELCEAGKPPAAVYAFEAPRISIDGTIASILAGNGVKVFIYRNGKDIVTEVPRLLHAWQHPAPLINIGQASMPVWNIEDHMIDNVIDSLMNQDISFQVRD